MPDGSQHIDSALRARLLASLRQNEINKAKYDSDLPTFAADCLKIRPNQGEDVLLRLNAVQRIVHQRAEDQLKRTGKVRLLVLKARKPGVSTYVECRFYWKTSRNRGRRAFILTHDDTATDNLFAMAKRFHDNNPHAPHTGKSNAKELSFDEMDSSYGVGTAGNKAVGRSDTIQFFHGSEVAYWPNATEHAAGIMQAVPGVQGTEIWLESTANGVGGVFYNMCMAAERRQGEFELVFIPWFAHDEYSKEPPSGWRAPDAFVEYADLGGLNVAQVYWAYVKNAELAAAEGEPDDQICWKFRQEFPANVEEAFNASREGSFIESKDVLRARQFQASEQSHAPVILGCDFACGGEGEGGDLNAFIDRHGRMAGERVFQAFREHDHVAVANRLARIIDVINPAMCFLDTGGGGSGVHDILKSRGYGAKLTLINFGSRATEFQVYANKRAEMWGNLRDWLKDAGGADIPDDEALASELTAPNAREDVNQRKIMEKKADIKKRFGFSPDRADALALTFAEPVHVEAGVSGASAAPSGPSDPRAGY